MGEAVSVTTSPSPWDLKSLAIAYWLVVLHESIVNRFTQTLLLNRVLGWTGCMKLKYSVVLLKFVASPFSQGNLYPLSPRSLLLSLSC